MRIRIIAGVFGHRDGDRVVPVRAGDDPIEVAETVARRLLACGVAEAVEEPQETGKPDAVDGEAFPDYDEGMTRAELEAIAERVGITSEELKAAAKKADVIALLDEAKADREADDAPTFDVAGDML